MNFFDSEAYLYSLGNEVAAMKLGLENIRTLLDGLGEPQTSYLKVQVAGTNGKGSVCAFLDSICRQANIKTGLYTSPHLISITERVKIDGVDIGESEFARIATLIRETAEQLLADGKLEYRPTFFEQMTAIALVAFAEANVELAILETGLGGRLDATTAANAEIAAITRIDLDHQEYLGETIEEIASEKAAIINSGSKVVVGAQAPIVSRVIDGRCREVGVEAVLASDDFSVKSADTPIPLLYGTFRTPHGNYTNLDILFMPGFHQFENASIAIALAEVLQGEGLGITPENICLGISKANHPGRLEYAGRFLFDGAHNIGGANALANFIREYEKRPIMMIFGAMNDKSVAEMLAILTPLAERIVFTEPTNSRSLSYVELLEALPPDISREAIFGSDNVNNAIQIAESITPADGIILVTGSLYLVGEIKSHMFVLGANRQA